MRGPGEICWSRAFVGGSPECILLGEQRVAYGYLDRRGGGGAPFPSLVCLDLEGQDRWSAREFQLWFALPGDRFVGATPSGLRVLDRDGRVAPGIRDGTADVTCNAVFGLAGTRDHLHIKNDNEMLVTDRALNLIDRLPLPPSRSGVCVGDGVAYLQDDRIEVLDRRGRAETLCNLPLALVEDTMRRWEQETGLPALAGVVSASIPAGADLRTELPAVFEDAARQTAYGIGDRPRRYEWRLDFVESTGTLFLYNFLYPHIVVCVGLDGRVHWCTYLDSACCGGCPIELPNGRLVVSSGCGGILSWLDRTGTVARTRPHDGTGLATAYHCDVKGLSSSACIVSGGPGVVAYGATGELLWRFPDSGSCYDYDEQRELLVKAGWSSEDGGRSVAIQCISHVPSGAPPRAVS